ncbi:M20/M25/M40 family metallo-hydrolase [Nesterenkonia pannonica]|uniref:M20/M25/M40 family metallo-hydrolase n=1 Tax=Nesterenkonia pannonica TaxID=1548602 RepID=UPI0021646AB9|nr:M20/M25/M40 family metallo-hydrolase [Nesterenkonia pannonica]
MEVESPSSDYEAVARGAAEVAQLAAERLDLKTGGVTAETLTDEGVTHVRIRFGSSDPRVLLVNHQDTVWPIGTLARKPFAHEDGVLRGPGVFDMLTGVVMSIHAAALLQEVGEDLTGLSIVVTGDEEVGSATGRRLLLDEGRSARAAFVMEGAIGERGDLKIARKGTADWQVHVHGRAAHAGLDPEKGINAGIALGRLLPHIEALGDPQAGTTVTPTIISAGTTTNTVPDLATVAVDGRATSVAEQERTDQQIRALTSPVEGPGWRSPGASESRRWSAPRASSSSGRRRSWPGSWASTSLPAARWGRLRRQLHGCGGHPDPRRAGSCGRRRARRARACPLRLHRSAHGSAGRAHPRQPLRRLRLSRAGRGRWSL